jgi:hypothetical protein
MQAHPHEKKGVKGLFGDATVRNPFATSSGKMIERNWKVCQMERVI